MKIITRKSAWLISLLLACAFCMAGCVSKEPEKDDFFDHWKAKAKASPPYTPTQQELSKDILVDGNQDQTAVAVEDLPNEEPDPLQNLPKTPISVRFIDDDLATSLRTLARIGGQNILLSPSVEGKLNLHTQETPWDRVFLGIIESYNLTVVKEANLLHVMSMSDMKQQVERKVLKLQEQQISKLVTRIVPIEFSDPATIVESVNQLLSKDKEGKTRGSATVDQHSRSLIVTESEENLNKLLSLIHDLDKPTAQILIEAHIVETTRDTARELGIQWGAITNPFKAANTLLATGSGTATYDSDRATATPPKNPFQYSMPNIYNVNLGAADIKGLKPSSIGAIVQAGDGILVAQLSALQRDGKLNILSSPSIATLDNSEALIESGKSVPFQTVSAEGNPQIEYKDATLNLTVIPHVISDKAIKLNIVAKKDEVDFSNTVNGNPQIIKKQAKTQLIVENNATVVLAGLSKETQAGSNAGVPGVKNIPGLGWLFKNDSSKQEFEEMLIFITPKILTKPEQTDQEGNNP